MVRKKVNNLSISPKKIDLNVETIRIDSRFSTLKVILIFCLFFFISHDFLEAEEYFRLNPIDNKITYRANLLNLQKLDINHLIYKHNFESDHFMFPFTSYNTFIKALTTFTTSKSSDDSFIDYQVVDETVSGRLQVNIGGGVDYHTDFDEYYVHPYRRVRIRGNIFNRLVFWGDWWAGRFQGDLNYAECTSPLLNRWHKSHELPGQTYTNLNSLSGQISYFFDFGNVSLGRGTHQVGDNIGGSIILNDAVNDYGYFSSKIVFGKLQLTFLHGSLIPNERDPIYSDPYDGVLRYVDKFFSQHQVNYQPFTNLELFFGEQVIYANRSVDISYLLPHTFYRIIEHNLHDRDNMLIYAGGRWLVNENLTLYGNLALDELRKSEIFGNWWGNKYALQGGFSLKYLPGFISKDNKPIRTTFEMTAVRPWTYTHKSYHTNTSHDGVGLGFPEGSNLIQGATQTELTILPYLGFNFFTSYIRQGSWGNCWSLNYTKDRMVNGELLDTAKWFEGDITNTFRSKGVFALSILAHHSVNLGIDLTKQSDKDWLKELIFSYEFMY